MAACSDSDAPTPSATGSGENQDRTGTAIAFEICVDNKTWTRPPLEEHRARLEQDPRYPVDENLLAWYDAHLIRDIGSASEDRKYGWAGIWSDDRVPFEVEGPCAQPRGVVNPVATREVVELWLLNHETVAVRDGPAALVVEVRPRDRGYQVIHFRNPMQEEGTAWGLIRFVDEQGREVAHIGPNEMQGQIGRAREVQGLP
jgi:hypothetical protein